VNDDRAGSQGADIEVESSRPHAMAGLRDARSYGRWASTEADDLVAHGDLAAKAECVVARMESHSCRRVST